MSGDFLIAKGGKFVVYTDPADIARQQAAIARMQKTNPALIARIQSGEQARLVAGPTHDMTVVGPPPTLTNAQRMAATTSKLITAMGGPGNIKPGTGQPIDISKVKPAAIAQMIEDYEIEAPGPVTNLRHLTKEVSTIKAQGNATIDTINANLAKNSDAYFNPSKYNWSTYEGGYSAFKKKYQELITSREKISEVLSSNDKKVLEYADKVANWGKNVTTSEVTKWKVGDVTYDTYEAALKAQEASQKWTVEGKTYDTFADAEKARIAATKYTVTYKEPGSDTESSVTFDTKDQADHFREQLREPALVQKYQGIPGPGRGPIEGSIGYGVSKYLTDAIMTYDAQFENVAQFFRDLSSKAWISTASASQSSDVVGNIWHLSGAVSTRLTAGIFEGATFLVRPVQWAQLAALPIVVASNPTLFLNTIKPDIGGIVLESVGAFAGGFVLGKGISWAKDIYGTSEYAQLKKLQPLDTYGDYPDLSKPIDYSANPKFGDYTSANKALDSSGFKPLQLHTASQSAIEASKELAKNAEFLKKLRSRASYSSLLPVMELDEILLNPKLAPLISAEKMGLVTSTIPLTKIGSLPTEMTTEIVVPKVVVSPSVVSAMRVTQQTKQMTDLITDTDIIQKIGQIDTTIADITPTQIQTQIEEQIQIQIQKTEEAKKLKALLIPKFVSVRKKLKLRTHEFPEGSKFRVNFTYAKGHEQLIITTSTFEGALSSALNSRRTKLDPVKTEIRRV
jgi:hypothetical protein